MADTRKHFSPFAELARMDPFRGWDDVFNRPPAPSAGAAMAGPASSTLSPDAAALPRLRPRIEVRETAQAYLVQAELPGVAKADIEVEIGGGDANAVSIAAISAPADAVAGGNADRTAAAAAAGAALLLGERRQVHYLRRLRLPQPLDPAAAQALYRDGMLELRLPKRSGRRLTIH